MVYRKSTLAILLALIFLSFFGILTLSASMFPQNYDWRYRVISNLLSPRDNPDCYWIAAVGLGLSGVLMLPFAGYLGHSLRMVAPRMAKVTAAAFVLGIISLVCACVVFPQHTHATLGIQRLHEFLGHSSAGFFCNRHDMWMLVRVESPRSKLGGSRVVLELVARHRRTADWIVWK